VAMQVGVEIGFVAHGLILVVDQVWAAPKMILKFRRVWYVKIVQLDGFGGAF